MGSKYYYVYILSSLSREVLYVGVTNNLIIRAFEHKNNFVKGFTQKYKVKILVHVEQYCTIYQAITREKKLKNWHRLWKIQLIEQNNFDWNDLSKNLL